MLTYEEYKTIVAEDEEEEFNGDDFADDADIGDDDSDEDEEM